MANEEHLRILRQGVDRWNQLREDHPFLKPDLSNADLSKTNLSFAKLSKTNLSNANLSEANLSNATLSNAYLSNATLSNAYLSFANLSNATLSRADLSFADLSKTNLSEAYLSNAYLSNANLSEAYLSNAKLSNAKLSEADLSNANLSEAYLSNAKLSKTNLSKTNLSNADLSNAKLSFANLSFANLSNADLNNANLWRTQALAASFSHADLTGACTEDWHINSATKLDHVVCEYIFLKGWQQERRPSNHNKIFAPGDFAKLLQKGLETVDLIFSNGIDWKAFAISLEDLRVQYGEQDLSIQAIENKNDGTFVIRLNVPPDADKEAIERQAMELYETRLAVLEAQYQGKLKAKSKELNSFRRELQEERRRNTWMERIIQTMSEKENSKYDLRYSKFGGGFASNGGVQIGGTFIDASSNQTLVEVAQEIQQLYDQILQTQPSETLDELELTKQVKTELEKRPTLKERFVGLLENGGAEALKEIVNRSGFNILLEAARGWMNP